MAVAVVVLGKENSPKYLVCINSEQELQLRYKMHTALDFIEEKLSSTGKSLNDVRELYLGQLYAAEDYKLYGYVTNTKIKFIIAVDPTNMIRDNEIRAMFRTLHGAYADAVCCPFYVPGSQITSSLEDGCLTESARRIFIFSAVCIFLLHVGVFLFLTPSYFS